MNRNGSAPLWLLSQSWEHVLFAHWREDPRVLAKLLPSPLQLDTHQGDAWLSLVLMRVRAVHPLGLFPTPLLSPFAQLHWRTYVRYRGRPAVYYLKLEAASAASLAGGRFLYRLPYSYAPLAMHGELGTMHFQSPQLRCSFRPAGPARQTRWGTAENWLLERYTSFVVDGGRVLRADLDHPPWEVNAAAAELDPVLPVTSGLSVAGRPSLLHYASAITTKISRPFCYP